MTRIHPIEQVILPRCIANQLLHQAQINPQGEICGLISAREGTPVTCYLINNIAPDPQQQFLMDPQDQIKAMRCMREQGEELFAIYHSHLDIPPWPSKSDLTQVAYPEALYLIISLSIKGVLEMRGFRLREGIYKEIELQL
ncbi:Mov34/MPN/PAD-1 family protein [Candidatus Nitrosoglobus terrae]|uniref:Mov34/MPN/PAD-1 family protein n=1 Tax=Candidatus Nitrosoglobus terrae TaxID=1630141 RepID=A0A1Q2SPF0_9GAMM|nr:M67 family metallopeptidase [Candidatus Nitrosoglobus terrae]BAW81035.1 Mov34/MPN/PAD-1 family protein [Candidatus Nitrosoglobus terrae]